MCIPRNLRKKQILYTVCPKKSSSGFSVVLLWSELQWGWYKFVFMKRSQHFGGRVPINPLPKWTRDFPTRLNTAHKEMTGRLDLSPLNYKLGEIFKNMVYLKRPGNISTLKRAFLFYILFLLQFYMKVVCSAVD